MPTSDQPHNPQVADMKVSALPDPETGYILNIDEIRAIEYPSLTGKLHRQGKVE